MQLQPPAQTFERAWGPPNHGLRPCRQIYWRVSDLVMPKTKAKSTVRVERELEFLREAPEVSIFLACVSVVDELRCLAGAYEAGEISRVAFSRESSGVVARLSDLVSATERFDIVCPVLEFGQFSPFFWRWFNWWSDYVKDLRPSQLGYLERLAREGSPATDKHRPKDHWVSYRHTPAFALVVT